MGTRFVSREARDDLAHKLAGHYQHMLVAMSQGHDHTIRVTPEMAEDILVAAGVIGIADFAADEKTVLKNAEARAIGTGPGTGQDQD